jgi:hypothetical protein
MFSFLKTGDIHNTIRGLTNLPGLFTADGDKIKYALLNHSAAMRKNLGNGAPIFTNIRQCEADIERRDIANITSGILPSMAVNAAAAAAAAASKRSSLFADNAIRIDNAALAFIMAKELAFLNRTIQMISLIAARYQEEQEDLLWGWGGGSGSGGGDLESGCDGAEYSDGDNNGDDDDDDDTNEEYYEDDSVPTPGLPGLPLQRSCSSSYRGTAPSTSTNQLSATFIIASGRLRQRFNSLCDLTGTGGAVLVNGMTTMDQPHNAVNREKQLTAQSLVIANIFLHFEAFDAEHRDPVVTAFLELRDISVSAWRIMSMFAFSNLFRLTQGTEFAIQYQPDDAIFTQGRDYGLHGQTAAATVATAAVATAAVATAAADAEATADAEAEAKALAEMEAIEYD